MEIRKLDNGSLFITGYVNITEKPSRIMKNETGNFVERVESRAFTKALLRGNNVKFLLNHNHDKHLGSLEEGNLKLKEDNIGLKIEATINNDEVRELYENGGFNGFSYGFKKIKDEYRTWEPGVKLRTLKDIVLTEVSLLDSSTTPAYFGTMVNVEQRSEGEDDVEMRYFSTKLEDEKPKEIREVEKSDLDLSAFFDAKNFLITRR